MSFAKQQTRRHIVQSGSRLWDSSSDIAASESDDNALLLFSPPSTVTPSNAAAQEDWTVVPAFVRAPAKHEGDPTPSSSSSSSTAPPLSPPSMSASLFPSHDGGGIFGARLSDSLVMSEAPSIYASTADLDGEGAYATEDDSIPSSDDYVRAREQGRVGGTRRLSLAGTTSSSFSDVSYPSIGRSASDAGSSWALTEAALSTIPDASSAISATRPESAAFTSDSSEDEREGNARRRPARYDELEDEDEELLSRTPSAVSAGLGALYRKARRRKSGGEATNAREAYPSPPPESVRSGSATKRRHREAGRFGVGGSQKRSSASGSVGGSASKNVEGQTLAAGSDTRTRSGPSREQLESQVFLGRLVGKVVRIDKGTLNLLSTPTPTRASSPALSSSSHLNRHRKHASQPHGLDAFAHFVRSELDTSSRFHLYADASMSNLSEEEESGNETETEPHSSWYTSYHPPTHLTPAHRSHSLSSLPSYLHSSPTSSVTPKGAPAVVPPPTLRRTSSFSSRQSAGSGAGGKESTAWGGEFDGLEAAVSYWRRWLAVMRGY
jgi:hypothetical protein